MRSLGEDDESLFNYRLRIFLYNILNISLKLMPKKRKRSVTMENIDYMMGDKKARLRSSDGKYKKDPWSDIFGKKKRKR